MKTRHLLLLMFLGVFSIATAVSAEFRSNVLFGYNGGPGLRVGGTVSDFAVGFPLALDLAVGYTSLDPGDPVRARRVFINNNTTGTPEESGHRWDFRLDFLYPLSAKPGVHLLAGVRHSRFTGNFVYIGGNEDFDVTTDQWGVGLGARGNFPITSRLGLVVGVGLDYYFRNTLTGHDTRYTPEDENINPREEYLYRDADDAINQPGLLPVGMIGLSIGF